MANEVAALGIKVDATDVKSGGAALDDFASKGAKVENAMDGVEKSASKTGKSLKTMGVDGAKGLQDIATATPKVATSFGGIAKSAEDAQKALSGINSSLAGLGKVSDTANQAANGLAGFTRSLADSKKSLTDMQAQVREASLAANQMGSAFANARASVQSSVTSQSAVAKSTSDMGAAYKTAGDQVNAYAKAPEAAASANQRVSKSMDVTATAARSLQSAMAVVGLSFGATELIAMVDGYTKVTAQLRLATNSAASYASAMESVKRISKDAQQGLNEVGTLYARIANGTAELGLSQQKLSAITEVVALSLKASGATASEASSAMIQLSQAFASGVLRGEEFNSVNEAAPRLMKALADGIGKPVGALRNMAEEGKLTAEVLANALPRALEEVRTEAAKMQTIGGAFTVLKNSMMEFFGTTSQASGAVSTITKSVELLAENLNLVTAAALGFGATKLATFLAESGKKAIENTASTAAYVTSLNQQRAAAIASAQAEASVSAARVAGLTSLTAKLAAERQAALADAASATSLAVKTNALMAASIAELNLTRTTAQLTAATTAQTIAQSALSGAITATSTAATLASRALALVGGPIGLITTALGLGVTAWMAWGNSSESAANQAKGAVVSGHHEILFRLDEQIRKLKERSRLLATGNIVTASAETEDTAKLASLNAQIEDMKKRSAKLTGVEQIALIELQAQYDGINGRLEEEVRLREENKKKIEETAAISFLAANEDGITQKFLDQVAGYEKALSANLITTDKYREAINRLNKERIESTAVGKEAAKQSKANDSAAKAETSAYATMIASIRGKIAAYEEEARGLGAVTEGDKLRLALQAQIESGSKKLSSARRAEAEADLQRLSVLEREKQIREQDAKNATAVGKEIDAIWNSADAYAQKSKELEAANEAYGKGAVAIAAMTLATKKQRLEDLEALGLTGDRTEALKAEIDEMERYVEALKGAEAKKFNASSDELVRNAKEMLSLYQSEAELGEISAIERAKIVALRQVELKYAKELDKINRSDLGDEEKEIQRLKIMEAKQIESSAVVSKVIQEDFEKRSKMIGDTLSDYIMGGGKDAATYLKRLFSNLILQPIVQAAVGGLLGSAGGAGSGTGALGAVGSVQSIWSGFSGGLTSSLGGAIAGLGTQLGSTAATAFGSGIAAGGQLGLFGGGVSQGISLIGSGAAGSTAAGLGTIAGAVAPWLAGASALLSIIKGFDDSGTPHSGAGAVYSKAMGLQTGAGIYNQGTFGLGTPEEYSEAMQEGISGIAKGLGQTLDAFSVAFGKTAGYSIATAFADDSSKDGAWGSLKIADEMGKVLVNWEDTRSSKWAPREFANGEEGYKQYLNDVAMDVKNAFIAMDLPAWADEILNTAEDVDTLNAALQQIATVKTVFEGLGQTMAIFSNVTDEAQTRLLAASGGIDALSGNAQAFYEVFYSESERAQKQRELQMKALSDAGLYIDPYQGDAAKEMFRKTVEEAMASGQSELAAKLLAMSAAFGETAEYGQSLLDATEVAAKDLADAAEVAAKEAAATEASWTGLGKVLAMFSGITADMQAGLLAAAGSMEVLTSGAQDFSQGFYSGEERALRQRENQISALAGLGLYIDPAEGNKAKELFRKTVEEAMATGQVELAVKLQAMSGAFADTADYAQEFFDKMKESAKDAAGAAAQSAIEATSKAWTSFVSVSNLAAQYTGNTSGLSAQLGVVKNSYAGATTTEGRVAALQQIISLEQNLWQIQEKERQKASEAEKAASQAHVDQIKAAAQIEADSARKRIEAAREQLNSANDLLRAAQSLGDFAEKLGYSDASGLSEADRFAVLQSTYTDLLGKAQRGDAAALEDLQGVSSELLQLKSLLSSGGVENSVFAGRVAAELASASALQQASATSQIASLDRQIAAAEAAVTLAQETVAAAVVTASYSEQQFSVSKGTQKLIDALLIESADSFDKQSTQAQKLIDQGVLTTSAIQSLPAEIAGAIGATLMPAILALAAGPGTVSAASIPQFASGGDHFGGLRIVGENGWEVESTGPSRIFNQSQLADAFSGGNESAALMSSLISELRASKGDQRVFYGEQIRVSSRTARILEMWNLSGLPEEREQEPV